MRRVRGTEPWFRPLLPTLKAARPGWELKEAFLFKGAAHARYLVTEWRNSDSRIDFHKVMWRGDGRARLRFLRLYEGWRVELVPPSGRPLAPGEPPVAVLYFASGGSGAWGYRERIVLMARNTVDITPPWAGRLVGVADLDDDRHFEVVAIDGRWAGYFHGRGSAGPHLPVILTRREHRFAPACRTFPAVYRRRVQEVRSYVHPEDEEAHDVPWAEAMAGELLADAQIGAFAEARAVLRTFEEGAATSEYLRPETWKTAIADFGAVLDQAERVPNVACPVSATESTGGHAGWEARIRSFR